MEDFSMLMGGMSGWNGYGNGSSSGDREEENSEDGNAYDIGKICDYINGRDKMLPFLEKSEKPYEELSRASDVVMTGLHSVYLLRAKSNLNGVEKGNFARFFRDFSHLLGPHSGSISRIVARISSNPYKRALISLAAYSENLFGHCLRTGILTHVIGLEEK